MLGDTFYETYIFLDTTNIGESGPLEAKLEFEMEGAYVLYDSHSRNNRNEKLISSLIFEGFEIGINICIDYFIEYHLEIWYIKKQSEANLSLNLLPTNYKI